MMNQRTIGVVMDFFRPGIVEGAGAYARRHGLKLDARWSVRGDWMPKHPEWDGVLVQFLDMKEAYSRVIDLELPMVHLGPGENQWSVTTDYEACGRAAAREFREHGIRRVCAVESGGSLVTSLSSKGFLETSRELGMETYALAPLTGFHDVTSASAFLFDQLHEVPHPIGLFFAHAGVLYNLENSLMEEGIRIPEDIALMTIDKDVQQTSEFAPIPLTAVVPDDWQHGYEAAAMLAEVLDNAVNTPLVKLIPPLRIQTRQSTGALTVNDPVVLKVLHLIQSNRGTILGVDDLVRAAGVSRRTLEVRFRKETGRSLHDALTASRMEKARRLLAAKDRTILEITEDCGFSSVHYFCTAFKRQMGMPPGAWQRKHSEG